MALIGRGGRRAGRCADVNRVRSGLRREILRKQGSHGFLIERRLEFQILARGASASGRRACADAIEPSLEMWPALQCRVVVEYEADEIDPSPCGDVCDRVLVSCEVCGGGQPCVQHLVMSLSLALVAVRGIRAVSVNAGEMHRLPTEWPEAARHEHEP